MNQWVTDGFWFDAPGTMSLVDRFDLGNVEGHEAACRWMTDFVRLYRPLVEHLLLRRDRYLARRPDLPLALQDHRLEVLSAVSIAYGCNIGAFVSGVASGSVHGWLWIAAALPGTWLGDPARYIGRRTPGSRPC